MQTDLGLGVNGLDIFGNSVIQTPADLDRETPAAEPQPQRDIIPRGQKKNTVISRSAYLQERIACAGDSAHEKEKQAWKTLEPIRLQPQEHVLFRHFAEHISQWMDLFDPQKPFGTLVPHLALHNVGLMNAILALSARHLRIVNRHTPTCAGGFRPDASDTIRFYYRTLRHSQTAMRHDTYKTSLELLAGALVISSYEMLDGSGADWGKHLKGVFWIQRSQVIHGDSGGLRQAVWWAWVCQDAWAAFRERRKPFTFWQPARGVKELNPSELAARAVYNFAQVVGYCAAQDDDATPRHGLERSLEADVLLQRLEEWKAHLTVEFEPLPLPASPDTDGGGFEPVWIRPAAFGVAMQIYYCSLILVHLNRPCSGGTASHLHRQKNFRKWANIVCGIAQTSGDYGSSVMSTQCAFIAGMVLEDDRQRSAVLDLIGACSQRAGWPGYSLERELKQIWQQE
ncbi:hypothetical protein N3K66_006470 [Trichothecium roseum]|uniref:Uncharacterized protein n=1 Tax=Trichothecium roseum TaxID=47278 RepID=A0ACC0UX79_9HYPO|nr:hypothetical protein N3K66_006470 [Trichothecium roseum]